MEEQFVKVEDDNGNSYNMLILKEFDYKKKKYAVLMETDKCECGCDDDCNCDDDCDCGCKEGEECTCHGKCNEEPMLCLLEVTKDEKGEEMFVSIEDEKLFDEVVKEADKVLYD